ncbi:MAG: peptidoglycan recognition family protein [Acidobacteriota bacterium]
MVELISRDTWGAAAPLRAFRPMPRVLGIVGHHSAGRDTSIGAVPAIQAAHLGRGWVDIGYHYLITGIGEICVGRPELHGRPVVGAHSPGVNASHLGVCLLGDFRAEDPTPHQVLALVELCQWLALRHQLRPLEISGHRDHRATLCPGERLYRLLPLVRLLCARPFTYQLEVAGG